MQWDARIGRRIKLRDLHIFLAVVQAGSMGKGGRPISPCPARRLEGRSPRWGASSVSRCSIAAPRGVEPTRYGRALVRRSLAVFDELKQGVKEIEYLSDPAVGELGIGSTEPLSAGLVTHAIDRLSGRYPLISFQVTQGDPDTLLRRLDERAVDIVLARMSGRRLDDNINGGNPVRRPGRRGGGRREPVGAAASDRACRPPE